MDPLSISASVIAFVQLSKSIATLTAVALGVNLPRQYLLLSKNYGFVIAFFVSTYLPDTAGQYERIQNEILHGPAENTMIFRQTVTDECNMTAVAGAIIAQVAITGLSLANLSAVHWFARALLLLAVVSGCLSVNYACVLQRTIGRLYHPNQVKNWLRLPPPLKEEEVDNIYASLAAVFIVAAPFKMVKVSIFSFLLGLAIYQGFVWTRSLDTTARPGDSRNVFITFLVASGVCFLFFLMTFLTKGIENLLRFLRLSSRSTVDEGFDRIHAPDSPQPSHSIQMEEQALSQEHEQVTSGKNEREIPVTDLASALQFAARAHLQCVEADRRVASEYAKMSSTISESIREG